MLLTCDSEIGTEFGGQRDVGDCVSLRYNQSLIQVQRAREGGNLKRTVISHVGSQQL